MMSGSEIVKIDGEEYSLIVEPAETSALVAVEKKELEGSLDLKSLVTDLKQVGGFIRIAYNAVAGADSEGDTNILELQLQIQRLGYDIMDLCSESVVTVASFKSTTRTILQELLATYQFLLDGLEGMAIDTLSELSTLAGKMATAAQSLQEAFNNEAEKVKRALETVQETQCLEESENKKIKEKQRVMELQQSRLEKTIDELKESEEEAKMEKEYYEKKEESTVEDIESNLVRISLLFTSNGITDATVAALPFMLVNVAASKIGLYWYKRKAKERLEKEKDYRRQRRESLQQKEEFLSEMKSLVEKQSDYATAIGFLHQACGSLRELSIVMKRAAIFWRQLQQHCQSLADDGIKGRVESAMKYPETKRLKVWTSQPFKVKAVTYYAKWVALHAMCHEYMGHIQRTQEELFRYIRENPTHEESRRRLPDLIEQYIEDLEKQKENIKESDIVADEKIKMLEQEESSD